MKRKYFQWKREWRNSVHARYYTGRDRHTELLNTVARPSHIRCRRRHRLREVYTCPCAPPPFYFLLLQFSTIGTLSAGKVNYIFFIFGFFFLFVFQFFTFFRGTRVLARVSRYRIINTGGILRNVFYVYGGVGGGQHRYKFLDFRGS